MSAIHTHMRIAQARHYHHVWLQHHIIWAHMLGPRLGPRLGSCCGKQYRCSERFVLPMCCWVCQSYSEHYGDVSLRPPGTIM
jgi:hypothetical protein